MCKNALGINRYTPDWIAKAELGIFPIMCNIIKNIFGYWQHVLHAKDKDFITHALKLSIDMDRSNTTSYYTRIKDLLSFFYLKSQIYQIPQKNRKNYSDQFKKKLENLYESFYFNNLKSEGKTVRYSKIKKTYRYKKYLNFFVNNQLRTNIT